MFIRRYNSVMMKATLKPVLALFVLLSALALCSSQTAEDKQKEFAAHLQRAQVHLRAKRPDLAIPELQAATAINPGNAEVQGNLGVLLYFQGRFADAIPHLRTALELQPALIKIHGLLGIAEVHTLDFVNARKDLEASFAEIQDKKFKTELGLELVGLYTQQGDLDQAAGVLAQLRKTDPENAEVLYAAYRTYADLSSESMMALAVAAPGSAQMHQLLAHEEIKEGNTNGAIAQFRKAIELNPHLPGIHFELAELLHTAKDAVIKAEAELEYQAALSSNPLDEKAECGLAVIDAEKGNTAQAFAEYSRAAELQPADADAKLGMAKMLTQMDEPDKALPLLEQAVELEPSNETAHYRLGTLYRKKGRMEDAKREMDIFKREKDLKEKLRGTYRELLVVPNEIREDQPDEK